MLGQECLQLGQRDVGRRPVGIQDQARVSFDPGRPSITALPLRLWRPALRGKLLPADRARRAHAKPRRRLPPRQTTRDRGHDPFPKIHR